MYCNRCGKEINPEWKHCRYCGAPIKKAGQLSNGGFKLLRRKGLLLFTLLLVLGVGAFFVVRIRQTPTPPPREPESSPQAELIYASSEARSEIDHEGFVHLSEQSIPFPNGDIVYRQESTHLAYDSEAAEDYFDNLLLVYLLRDLTVKEKEALAKKVDGTIVGNISGAINAVQIQVKPAKLDKLISFCNRLMDTENVLYATYEFPIPMKPTEIEDLNPWGEEFSYFDDRNSGVPDGNDWWAEAIEAYKAWKYVDLHPADISDITVGIIDGGFSLNHEDLANKVSMLEGFEHNSESDHGTHVAGIIGAWNNDKGIRGIADRSRLLLADFTMFNIDLRSVYNELELIYEHNEYNQIDNGTYIAITKQMIESGAKVINNSWGYAIKTEKWLSEHGLGGVEYRSYLDWEKKFSRRNAAECLLIMTELAANGYQDYLIVQAAGNGYNNGGQGYDASLCGCYCSVTLENYEALPQKTRDCMQELGFSYEYFKDRILIVGAVNDNREYRSYTMTDFSNYGPSVDICAPGEDVFSTLSLADEPENDENNGKLYGNNSGTSMAAPMVSGAAALVWSVNPELSAAEVKEILVSCQRDGAVGVGADAGHTYPMLNVGMAVKKAAALKTYGYCGGEGDGTNLKWSYQEDGTLTISGQGKMADWYYKEDEEAPWYPRCEVIKTVIIENGVTSVGKYAFYGCRHMIKAEIADSVVSIDESAFSACSDLTDIKLSEGLRMVGHSAFSGCVSLSEIEIPTTIKEIGSRAFSHCRSLKKLTLPIGLQSLGSDVFYGCESMTSMEIPHSVNKLNGTFMYCTGLKQLYLPKPFSLLGYEALYKCEGMTDIYFEGSAEEWKKVEISSDNNNTLEHVTIHYGVQKEDFYRATEAVQEPEPQPSADIGISHEPAGESFSNPLQAYIAPLEKIVSGWEYPFQEGSGMLYDMDGDGFQELIAMYNPPDANPSVIGYSVYDVENGMLITRLENENLQTLAAGSKARVGVAAYKGEPVFLVYRHDSANGISDYEEMHLYQLDTLDEIVVLTRNGIWSKSSESGGYVVTDHECTINGESCSYDEYIGAVDAVENEDVLFTSTFTD